MPSPHREGAWGLCEQSKPCVRDFIGFLYKPRNISLFLLYFLVVDSGPPGSSPLKDFNRHLAPSRGGECTVRFLRRVLKAWAGEWARRVSELQRISLRERERRKKRKTRGLKLWWSKGVLFNIVWVFILSYKVAIFSRDKIKTYKLSRKHEVIHMKEGGL